MENKSPNQWSESYINDGYLLVPDVITPEECDEIKTEMLEIFRGGYDCTAIPHISETATENEILDRIMCVGEPHSFSPLIRNYVEHPKVCAILNEIVCSLQ